jgi:hypothetical protein
VPALLNQIQDEAETIRDDCGELCATFPLSLGLLCLKMLLHDPKILHAERRVLPLQRPCSIHISLDAVLATAVCELGCLHLLLVPRSLLECLYWRSSRSSGRREATFKVDAKEETGPRGRSRLSSIVDTLRRSADEHTPATECDLRHGEERKPGDEATGTSRSAYYTIPYHKAKPRLKSTGHHSPLGPYLAAHSDCTRK